jgi:hypothetical protein
MTEITWVEDQPSDSSIVGQAPQFLRTTWKNLAEGLATSLYWPGSGAGSNASQGELRPGVSLAFHEAASASSNSVDATLRGRPFLASDTTRLMVYESNGTYLVGTPFYVEHSTDPSVGVWVSASGSYSTDGDSASRIGNISFGLEYDGNPSVYLSSSNRTMLMAASEVTQGGFTSQVSYLGPGTGGSATFYWESLGTVSGAI